MNSLLYVPKLGLGDLVFSAPLLRSLQSAYPQARIEVYGGNDSGKRELIRELLGCSLLGDRLGFFVPRKVESSVARDHWQAVLYGLLPEFFVRERLMLEQYLVGQKFDVVLLSSPVRLSKVRGVQLNWSDVEKSFPDRDGLCMADQLLLFANLLGIPSHPNDFSLSCNGLDGAVRLFNADEVRLPEQYVVMHVGASVHAKRWSEESFRDVAKFCHRKQYGTVVVGRGPADDRASLVVEQAGKSVVNTLSSGSYVGLRNFLRLVKRAAVVLGGDSGPTHLSAAVKAKTVALFGPTDPRVYAPPFNARRVVCSSSQSMADITVSQVCEKLEELLV
ncbi:MAG: glycosyltransferase family 9 protein [Nanoarchaeota archaeon]|nr:glycosyltransferase family 9 protein [Nanoarchaeota archaeon]